MRVSTYDHGVVVESKDDEHFTPSVRFAPVIGDKTYDGVMFTEIAASGIAVDVILNTAEIAAAYRLLKSVGEVA